MPTHSKLLQTAFSYAFGIAVSFIAVLWTVHATTANADPSCSVITTSAIPFGFSSFDGAGDVDGDGFADILIGGDTTQIVSGRDGTVILSITSPRGPVLDGFGHEALSIADLNGDGKRDFIVSSVTTVSGRVDVYDGQTGLRLYNLTGPSKSLFGDDIDEVGDIDGDGVSDFIVGEPQTPYFPLPAYGRAFVYSGVDGSVIYSFTGSVEAGLFGGSVAGVGDVDTDGTPDFAIGEGGGAGTLFGAVTVYSGASGSTLFSMSSTQTSDHFAKAISSVGDVSLDGIPDIIVGAPGDASLGEYGIGRADVFSGQNGSLLFTLWPDTSLFGAGSYINEWFGRSVSGGNDLNNDGVPDILVGAYLTFFPGRAYVFSGADQSTLAVFTGQHEFSAVGRAVAMIGDANGDCIGDLAISESLVMFQNTCARPSSCASGCCNIPGDASNDNSFNIADVSFSIARIFSGGPSPACQDEADANGDNAFNIADVTFGIARIFSGGAMPVCGSTGL